MAYRIRETDFTWDPQRESRGAVSDRIRRHVRAELDRIAEASRRARNQARRRSSPAFQRNQSIFRDYELRGETVPTLARRYGVSVTQVREVIRLERHRRRSNHSTRRLPQGPVTMLPCRDLPDLPGALPQTRSVATDP